MAGSAALHAIILISGLIAWPWLSKPLHMGDVVPVTLITSNEAPAPKPAVQAPQPAPAATEAPVPQASPQVAAPEEAPTPTPPAPRPAPQPVPKPHQAQPAKATPQPAPTPTPHKTATAKPTPAKPAAAEMDMAALAAELAKQAKASGPRQSSAARGPSRPEQAVEARTASGTSDAVSAAALASLSGELQRIWNPICNNAGAADVLIKVSFRIGSTGVLIGTPQSSLAGTSDNALKVASERAVRAVYQHGPFADPAFRVLYGQNITVNFNQKKDCSNR
jgi:outer membrane biosynthesis protein TonB